MLVSGTISHHTGANYSHLPFSPIFIIDKWGKLCPVNWVGKVFEDRKKVYITMHQSLPLCDGVEWVTFKKKFKKGCKIIQVFATTFSSLLPTNHSAVSLLQKVCNNLIVAERLTNNKSKKQLTIKVIEQLLHSKAVGDTCFPTTTKRKKK